MARDEIVIEISAQDRFSSAFARIDAGMASLNTRLDEARQATAPLAEGLRRVAETGDRLQRAEQQLVDLQSATTRARQSLEALAGSSLGDPPINVALAEMAEQAGNARTQLTLLGDEMEAVRPVLFERVPGDDLFFSPAAIGAAEDFGRRAAGQVTGLGGAVAGFQAGGPLGALIGGLGDLVLSNSETQEFLAELNAGINDVLGPILRDVFGPTLEALAPAFEQLSAAMIELEPAFKALGIAIAVALAPMIVSMRALAIAIDFLADIDDALKSAIEFLTDAVRKLEEVAGRLTGGGTTGGLPESGLIPGVDIIPGVPFIHEGGLIGRGDLLRLPGMAADEGLAVLQTGETVVPRGGAGAQPGITFNITALDPRAVREEVRQVIEELALTGRLALAR